MVIFSIGTISARLHIEIEGEIIDRQIGKYKSGPHRWYVDYKILSGTGQIIEYRANGNDQSLSRNMPLGAILVKKRSKLTYALGDQNINDFPIIFYGIVGGIGMIILIFGMSTGIIYLKKRLPVRTFEQPGR